MRLQAQGIALLTSHLGDPSRPVLTTAQMLALENRARLAGPPGQGEVTGEYLVSLGCSPRLARQVLSLLDEENRLMAYLDRAKAVGVVCLTRICAGYPRRLIRRLGELAPPVLWAMGDLSILEKPAIALVGSRELNWPNRAFAAATGEQAARQGWVLVSGDARGADRAAQNACLAAKGEVISILPWPLSAAWPGDRRLLLWEDSFDLPFSGPRALSRNRVIHSLGDATLVAQSGLRTGGTWSGTADNLRRGLSPVYVYADGSPAAQALAGMGAAPISMFQLEKLDLLVP